MSLYEDFDEFEQKPEEVAGWSAPAGIKLFQSQMHVKKPIVIQSKREIRKPITVAPVFDLKNKKDDVKVNSFSSYLGEHGNRDMDWDFEGVEYSPLRPNDYDKVVKDLRDLKDKERRREEDERRKRRGERYSSNRRLDDDKRKSRRYSDSDDEEKESNKPNRVGAMIAPPAILQESPPRDSPKVSLPTGNASSVAAKIMAKYGFREGQGLGKQEQGMSMALQVEKTSKRGGRIIHEKEILEKTPEFKNPFGFKQPTSPPASFVAVTPTIIPKEEPKSEPPSTIDLLKDPSKVVLLKNMVGPGEVDDDLEPEVKEECNTKYGDVVKVIIYELKNVEPEEAIRIFVEFKRIESATKAVVDLNGRFFGGRQVKAGFYNLERFESFQLMD